MRRFFVCFLVIACMPFFGVRVSAADVGDQYWLILEKGKRLFQEGMYGDALLGFEDAIRLRRELYERSEKDLIDVLSTSELRRYGDDLSAVEGHVDSHKMIRARMALDVLYKIVDKEALANSVNAALIRLRSQASYPEAEYWKGEVFRIEGETGVALIQYQKALDHAAILEIPDEAISIRYRMAELRAARHEYNEMEKLLLKIIEADPLWSSPKNSFAREAMGRTFVNEGVDRFLQLYRHDSPLTYKAHRNLGLYYYKSGRHDRAFSQLLFAFLIASTNMVAELNRNDQDFSFSTLENSLSIARRENGASIFLSDVKYFMTGYYLAASLYANGNRKAANDIWRIIARAPDGGEWAGRSSKQLLAPTIESPTENPYIEN